MGPRLNYSLPRKYSPTSTPKTSTPIRKSHARRLLRRKRYEKLTNENLKPKRNVLSIISDAAPRMASVPFDREGARSIEEGSRSRR